MFSNCSAGRWKCKDGKQCIEERNLCDDEIDCIDKSDEDYDLCTQWTCTEGYWKCKDDFQCILKYFVCQGDRLGCYDESDKRRRRLKMQFS